MALGLDNLFNASGGSTVAPSSGPSNAQSGGGITLGGINFGSKRDDTVILATVIIGVLIIGTILLRRS